MTTTMERGAAWLLEGFCKMFYIVSPDELALGEDDVAPNYLLKFGIPMFFVFMALEWVYAAVRSGAGLASAKDPNPSTRWRVKDMVMCTAIGATQILLEVAVECLGLYLTLGVYGYVYENFRLTTVDVPGNKYFAYFTLMLGK